MADIREALLEVAEFLRGEAEVTGYGYSATEDPHDFTPDPECCTAEEIARHKAACDAWDRGEHIPVCMSDGSTSGTIIKRDDGSAVVHCHRAGWGIGTYVFRDEWMVDAAERLTAMANEMPDGEP